MTDIEPTTQTTDMGSLRRLLDEQEALFVRLDALSKTQRALVEQEQTDELLRVLTERQGVINGIESTSRDLAPYRDRWEDVLAEAKPDLRQRFAGQVDRLSEMAATIAARDDADRRLMEERRDRLATDLSGTGKAKGAVAAYGARLGPPPGAKFHDGEA